MRPLVTGVPGSVSAHRGYGRMFGLLGSLATMLAQFGQGQVPSIVGLTATHAYVGAPAYPTAVDPNHLKRVAATEAYRGLAERVGGSPPELLLDKTTCDFGQIKPASSNTATFRLANGGGSTLQITEVKRCCGAVAKLDKPKLEPGETGTLTAEYRASQVAGLLTKKIGLVTNDPNQPRVELTITGKVVQTLTWTPTRFELAIRKDRVQCPDITIKSLDGVLFSIKALVSTGQCLTADFDPTIKAMEFVLKPKVDIVRLEALASSTGMVRIELDHPDYKLIDLGFAVITSLQAIPSQILVFSAKPDEPVVRSIQVQDNGADPNQVGPVQIDSVTSAKGSRIEVRGTTETKKGCDLSLEIWPKREQGSESFWTDQLVIRMKDGRQLNLPLRVFYRTTALSTAVAARSNL